MTLFIVSFLAGALTVLTPCILPLLPIVIGAGSTGRSKITPYIIVASLALSIIAFTFLLKASTLFIMVPPQFWQWLSGGVIFLIGLFMLFPSLWEHLPLGKFSAKANQALGTGVQKKSFTGDILIGLALGPVFSTCSPTYFFILASILPVSVLLGSLYLLAFVLGLALVLLAIALLGERFVAKLVPLADSRGLVKRSVGGLLIVVAVFVITGYDKKIETYIIEQGWGAPNIEYRLLEQADNPTEKKDIKADMDLPLYREIQNPFGFVNSEPFKLQDIVGEKVILLDFMTYSCINCQRTFPYLNAWYDAYRDQGLEIVGIHTPEFAFEKDIGNVTDAAAEFGLEFPLVLDNEYSTWKAYANRYWPHKYLIDIHGRIVYDHIGEGAYEETEEKIRELLAERAEVMKENASLGDIRAADVEGAVSYARSPETYFGSARNSNSPQVQYSRGEYDLEYPDGFISNLLYYQGEWNIEPEYAESVGLEASSLTFKYEAKEVYIVAESSTGMPVMMEVWQDDHFLGQLQCTGETCEVDIRGDDVSETGIVNIMESKLYKLIKNKNAGEHTLELKILSPGARLFAFTFG